MKPTLDKLAEVHRSEGWSECLQQGCGFRNYGFQYNPRKPCEDNPHALSAYAEHYGFQHRRVWQELTTDKPDGSRSVGVEPVKPVTVTVGAPLGGP